MSARGEARGARRHSWVLPVLAVLALAAPVATAGTQYLTDGAVQSNSGGWDLPTQGTCYTGALGLTITTRPECLALRFPAYTSSSACTAVGTSPNNLAWTTSVCNDLDAGHQTQSTCEAVEGRLWSNGVCAVTMKDHSRNVATCTNLGGTWVTSGTCTGRWNAPSITSGTMSGTGTGDQCLRCHNTVTQYNGTDIRWVESVLKTGHKNMARKVTEGIPWAGPVFTCSLSAFLTEEDCVDHGGTWDVPALEPYPNDDSGNPFDWDSGTVTIGGTSRALLWIYGDWLGPYPRAIYESPINTSTNKPGVSYSCGRCHTTGWTSDATLQSNKDPEKSFPGVTWDGVSTPVDGQVNLAGGVTGDSNKMSSWDDWGITCARCHGAAVDNSSGTPPYSAPTGMSSHTSNLTAASLSSGVCTISQYTLETQCTAAGGTWITACSLNPTSAVCTNAAATAVDCAATTNGSWVTVDGWCSDPSYTAQADCTSNGFTWITGWCKRADIVSSASCTGGSGNNALTWRLNGTQASCQLGGGTWSFTSCTVPAICSKPGYTTYAACTGAGGTWTNTTSQYTCQELAGGHFTGNNPNRGQIITSLCMNCHRQETGGLPYDSTYPATNLKVGPYHNTVTFLSHPHANQFLNSPHGKFTGTFAEIPTGKFSYAGTGLYKSYFQTEGEASGTGNGCTGCHDVHLSVVPEAGQEGAIREECTECHAKQLPRMLHPAGTGTPLGDMTDPNDACESCHMPGKMHLVRVSADADYSTFPSSALTGNVNANTSPDGSYADAVWVDLDASCGQCHGGGSVQLSTTGSISTTPLAPATTKTLTVADGFGFAAGQRVKIAGAALVAGQAADFETYVASVDGNTVTLAGAASRTVTDAEVLVNPTANGAGYITKAQLAAYAEGIHNDAPRAVFVYSLGNPDTQMVYVDASGSTCNGSSDACDAYSWDWGDGSSAGSGVTASHRYASAGTRVITLTVEQYGVNEATASRTVNTYAYNEGPTIGGTCTFDSNTWTETVADASTDDTAVTKVTVTWGDGTPVSSDTSSPFGPFTHTYSIPGTFTVVHKAYDGQGFSATETCSASPAYFKIGGTVYENDGTTAVPYATVVVKLGTSVVRTLTTASNGTFTAVNLGPGAYSITVTKTGFDFGPAPQDEVVVGPTDLGRSIVAASHALTKPGRKAPAPAGGTHFEKKGDSPL